MSTGTVALTYPVSAFTWLKSSPTALELQEDYIAQQQKLQGEKDALEAECTKARAAGEQNQEQLEALRKKIEAADQKLEEEQQQRLREVKEIQVLLSSYQPLDRDICPFGPPARVHLQKVC